MKNLFYLITFAILFIGCNATESKNMSDTSRYFNIKAPAFPSGIEWLNTDVSYQLSDFRGKFVLLDFWTYCCINCIHVLPDLKKLEQQYPEELVVIGVHSAKFSTEKESDNIRQAILRYDIEHPVVNDKDFFVWRSYGVRAWPSFILIDPNGYIVGQLSGEGIYAPINETLQELIPEYEDVLNRKTFDFVLEKEKEPKRLLNFPGKILADEQQKRLYITDSNNNRILITDLQGEVLDVIGNGKQGSDDGSFNETQFFSPQGTALDGKGNLYIADTENHLIRKADLTERTVTTISGVGKQLYDRSPSGDAAEQPLNSPWDLIVVDDVLYIAMAGPHQIWAIDPNTNKIRLHAGSGVENIIDGKLQEAALAQPSGIALLGDNLYIADSEVSGIRKIALDTTGNVSTIIGKGLFDFGDDDGDFEDALLQHPLGITTVGNRLYIADTYNNKIKVLDLKKRKIVTYAGDGDEGMEDGEREEATFDEPAGITYADEKLYIADTNNHLIRVINMGTGVVSTLNITFPEKMHEKPKFYVDLYDKIAKLSPVDFSKTQEIRLEFDLEEGYKLNELSPSIVVFYNAKGTFIEKQMIESLKDTYSFPAVTNSEKLFIEVILYYCDESNEKVCLINQQAYELANETMNDSPVPVIKSEVKHQ